MIITRREALQQIAGSGLALSVLGGCGGSAKGSEADLRFGVLAGQDPGCTAYWVADDRGLFKQENLTTSIMLGGPNSPPLLTLLAARNIDIAIANWFSVADAVAQGNDFVIVGANYPRNPHCLMSRPERPIRTANDIIGKTLLLQFTTYKQIFDAILAYNKLQGSYSVSPVGYNADALFSGSGDGYFAFLQNGPLVLEAGGRKRGKDFLVTPLSDMGYTVPDGLYVVRRETLEKKKEHLAAFFGALRKGFAINAGDPKIGVSLLTEKYLPDAGINPATQTKTVQAFLATSQIDNAKPFLIGNEQIERMYAFASLSGRKDLPEASRLIDLAFVTRSDRAV